MSTLIQRPLLDPTTEQYVHQLAQDVAEFDGIAGISEQPLSQLHSPGYGHILSWHNYELAAYAHITPAYNEHPAYVELIVKPDYRREGIASAIIKKVISSYPQAHFWAYGNQVCAQAVANKFNAHPTRTLLQLHARVDLSISPIIPESITIRTYRGEVDNKEIIRLNNAAFSWHPEQSNWTREDLAQRLSTVWFSPQGLFIAEKNGVPVGFHWTKIDPDTPTLGEIYILATDPSYARQGIGSYLTEYGLHYFHQQNLSHAQLYVEADNVSALKIYTKYGFTTYRTHVTYATSSL